jgi:hypothetical protein
MVGIPMLTTKLNIRREDTALCRCHRNDSITALDLFVLDSYRGTYVSMLSMVDCVSEHV